MNAVAPGDWFITVQGEQKGPVSREELAHLAELGAIHPRNDMVWQAGMESWVVAGDLVPERPHRSEPRAKKRRPKTYQLMTTPRGQMKVSNSRRNK